MHGHLAASRSGALLRACVAGAFAACAGFVACVGAMGATGSLAVAIAGGVLGAVAVGWLVGWRTAIPVDASALTRGLVIVSALATLVAVAQLGRLAIFMLAPDRVSCSMFPSSPWEVGHSCLTAYFVAGEAVDHVEDVYASELYSLPSEGSRRTPRKIETFNVDTYEYPPPFLLLPRALGLVAPDFLRLRMLWHALNLGAVLLTVGMLARFLGPVHGTRMLLLFPLVLIALPTLSALQKGNAQLIVITLSLLAMLLAERGRHATAGVLLAYVTLSKIFPGMLLVYLLVRREWRTLAWTAAGASALVGVSLLDTGLAPYVSFADQLPALLGGEAFGALRYPPTMAINFSIPGLVFKLSLFGVPGMGFPLANVVGWLWTLVCLGVAILLAQRTLSEPARALAWLAILIFATLRSPFLPQAYAAFPPLWLLVVLAASHAATWPVLTALALGWIGLNLFVPTDFGVAPRVLALMNGVPQGITIALVVLVALRLARRAEPAPPTRVQLGASPV